jgi:outer membrane protein OmpA-like peptidoglycan-associated protein
MLPMKHLTLTFCAVCALFSFAFSQEPENLVPNPDFEFLKSDSLIHNHLQSKEFGFQMNDWETPTYGSTDILGPKFSYQQISPIKSGQYAIGMVLNTYLNQKKETIRYTEYIQCKLKKSLQPGKKYLVKFDIAGSEMAIDSSKYFGACFSKKKVIRFGTTILRMIPHVRVDVPLKQEWQTVGEMLVAEEAYEYLIIGFFENKTQLKHIRYAVDNVSIIEVNNSESSISNYLSFMGEEVVLSNVHFDTNSSELLPKSFKELEKAAQWLYNHPEYIIEIQGHTDYEGEDARNLKLSQARAEAVQHFLEDKGIPILQLKTKGYGESAPIADNKTAAGRAANRRVVLKKVNLLLKEDLYAEALKSIKLGQIDMAFDALEQMTKIGNLPMKLLIDFDLKLLHGDERWTRIKTLLFNEFQDAKTLRNLPLAYEFQLMLLENQSILHEDSTFWANIRPFEGEFEPKKQDAKIINQRHCKRLEELLGKKDKLPRRGVIGMSGVFGILAILQQSDDLAFQKTWLQKIEYSMKTQSEYKVIFAYLTDKIAVTEGKLQVYGTQKKDGKFYPIKDSKNLNKRRRKMNLAKIYFKK